MLAGIAVNETLHYNSLVTVARGTGKQAVLERLGERVRSLREDHGLSRNQLADASGLSSRYLAELEAGTGNISVLRLLDVAAALGSTAGALIGGAEQPSPSSPRAGVIALLGLRGAGKSTLGVALARRLRVRFHELDALVETAAGMSLAQIFEMHGERYYRRLEREALSRLLVETKRAVLATGGGIVTEPETYGMLRRNTKTVWLSARPRDHWSRVVAQGDRRPMADRGQAMEELEVLLAAREPLYARADLVVDTSRLDVDRAVERVRELLNA